MKDLANKLAGAFDDLVFVVSPERACRRKVFRFAYDGVRKRRLQKKRVDLGGTADSHLDENALWSLREVHRDMLRNNPLVVGLLKTERDGVVGSGVKIQARTGDKGLNEELEGAWQDKMVASACDVTGRFNFNKILRLAYLSYRRDGDVAILFLKDRLQVIEGDQIGTPSGLKDPTSYEVVNGIAYSKQTQKVVGYYIGKPNKWGIIASTDYKKYTADLVHLMFNPERISQSRGEPALASAINHIDHLSDYIDAELVAAKVNACFSMFVSQKNVQAPVPFTEGYSSTGQDENASRLEKIQPGMIFYGEPGEEATGIGQVRPGSLFDPFVNRMLTIIGRPLCMPLMLITLDFSGATFMNARIAYQKVQETWRAEQDDILKPFISRVWQWFVTRNFKLREGILRHSVICNRWPYVDPWKEAKADEQQLKNRTTTRNDICARQGDEFGDIVEQLEKEKKQLDDAGIAPEEKESPFQK